MYHRALTCLSRVTYTPKNNANTPAARPWERAKLLPPYAEQYAFPVSELPQLLSKVSMTATGKAMIDMVPAVLRSGEPYAVSVELETFVEEKVGEFNTCRLIPSAPLADPRLRLSPHILSSNPTTLIGRKLWRQSPS